MHLMEVEVFAKSDGMLLPTVSDILPRVDYNLIKIYSIAFLQKKPQECHRGGQDEDRFQLGRGTPASMSPTWQRTDQW